MICVDPAHNHERCGTCGELRCIDCDNRGRVLHGSREVAGWIVHFCRNKRLEEMAHDANLDRRH